MTTFEDGPAKGQTLNLGRVPFFLRVVRARLGTAVDALNEPNDTPHAHEEIFAYMLTREPGRAFVDGSKFRGLMSCANYRLVAEQPTDAVMRDAAAWAQWCAGRSEFPPAWAKKP